MACSWISNADLPNLCPGITKSSLIVEAFILDETSSHAHDILAFWLSDGPIKLRSQSENPIMIQKYARLALGVERVTQESPIRAEADKWIDLFEYTSILYQLGTFVSVST